MGKFNTTPLPDGGEHANPPRVLIVDLSIRYGGASTRALSIAKHFSQWGGMIAGIENSPVVRIAREMGIPVRVVGKRRTDPLIPIRLAQIIRREGIQVVDTQNIQSKFWVSLAAFLVDVTFVSTLNSSYSQEFGDSWKSRLYHTIDLLTNWKTDRFVAVSEAIQNRLSEDGIPSGKISLIKNAVVLPPDHTNFDTTGTRMQFGLPKDGPLCILVGRLVWAKGIDDFVSAFSLVVSQIENASAVIVGDGELRDVITNQIDELGLKDHVFLIGFQDHSNVLRLLMSSDIFVMPSRSEGVPYALLEAAALGMPISATDCGGIPEVVINGKSALLVSVGDISSLADSVVLLCKDKKLAGSLGKAAREKIEQDYSLGTQMELTRKIYVNAFRNKINGK